MKKRRRWTSGQTKEEKKREWETFTLIEQFCNRSGTQRRCSWSECNYLYELPLSCVVVVCTTFLIRFAQGRQSLLFVFPNSPSWVCKFKCLVAHRTLSRKLQNISTGVWRDRELLRNKTKLNKTSMWVCKIRSKSPTYRTLIATIRSSHESQFVVLFQLEWQKQH